MERIAHRCCGIDRAAAVGLDARRSADASDCTHDDCQYSASSFARVLLPWTYDYANAHIETLGVEGARDVAAAILERCDEVTR